MRVADVASPGWSNLSGAVRCTPAMKAATRPLSSGASP